MTFHPGDIVINKAKPRNDVGGVPKGKNHKFVVVSVGRMGVCVRPISKWDGATSKTFIVSPEFLRKVDA